MNRNAPIAFAITSLVCTCASAPAQETEPYTWKSVQMVGGGFVDGIIFHPTARGVRYCRTDIGGAYRWDDKAKEWTPLMDWAGWKDINLMGVESIALDPSDSNRLYMACGTYTNPTTPNGAILRSNDRGKTFQRADMPFKMGGNENGRGNGERLAVDPNDGRILYFGSRKAGLWVSNDRAVTWSHVENFPWRPSEPTQADLSSRDWYRSQSVGIVCVVFDPHSGTPGKGSNTVFAAVSTSGQNNLFRSTDHGVSWRAVPGEPTNLCPTRMVLASDGCLYVAMGSTAGPSPMRDGAVWKLNTKTGAWTDITPEKPSQAKAFGYGGISVEKQDPNVLLASSIYRPGGDEVFRSLDGGATWQPLMHKAVYDFGGAPYVAKTPIHWLFDVEIDPQDPNHAMFTTGYGGYETFNLSAADHGQPTHWSVMSKGIEETVALQMATPKSGVHLISAIGDYGGFVHWDLDRPSPEGNYENPRFGNTTSVACGEDAPNVVVRVGTPYGGMAGTIGYSLDGGKTWQPTATVPAPRATAGRIAVSADGKNWVWNLRSGSFLTRDDGKTWTECQGLSRGSEAVADGANPSKFYGMALFDGKLFTSTDGGATFTSSKMEIPGGLPVLGGDRGDNRGGQDHLYATPDREGDLWIAAYDGLYHSPDSGHTWTKNPEVKIIHALGFGKAAPGKDYPALYLAGVVGDLDAIFRSDDEGKTWTRINDDRHRFALILQIAGDPRIYGRVYVGIHGRGIVYGDPAERK